MQNLKYPIGPDETSDSYSRDRLQRAIQQIKDLPQKLAEAVDNLSDEQLDTPYRPGGWTVRQVIHHLADSHMNGYIRTKWALTEELTTIKAYYQQEWAQLVDYSAPVSISLQLLAHLHARWGYLLEHMDEEEFRQEFNHPESGRQALWQHVEHYDWHGRHHLAHITELIERENW